MNMNFIGAELLTRTFSTIMLGLSIQMDIESTVTGDELNIPQALADLAPPFCCGDAMPEAASRIATRAGNRPSDFG